MGLLSAIGRGARRLGGTMMREAETPFMRAFSQHKEMLAMRVEQASPEAAQAIRSARDETELADIVAQMQGSPAGPQAGVSGIGGMSGRVPNAGRFF